MVKGLTFFFSLVLIVSLLEISCLRAGCNCYCRSNEGVSSLGYAESQFKCMEYCTRNGMRYEMCTQ